MYRTKRSRTACGRLYGLGGLPWAAALLLVLGLARPASAEKTALVFAAPPGDTLHYDVQMSREGIMGDISYTLMQKGRVHIAAVAKGGDKSRVSLRFTNWEASVKQGDHLTPQKSELNGVTVDAVVSPRGEVSEITPRGSVPPATVEMVQNLADNVIPYLPEAAVDPGATWVRKRLIPNTEDPSGKPRIDGSTEFTLDETKKKDGVQVADILGKTTAKVGQRTPMGVFDGKATGESRLLVAVQGGYILECKASADYSGSVGGQDMGWSQTFQMKQVR